jgi:hypothetical protein
MKPGTNRATVESITADCTRCEGTGWRCGELCDDCLGVGRVVVPRAGGHRAKSWLLAFSASAGCWFLLLWLLLRAMGVW